MAAAKRLGFFLGFFSLFWPFAAFGALASRWFSISYCDLPGQVASASDLDSSFSEVVLHAESSVDIILDWMGRLGHPLLPPRLLIESV